MSLPLDLLGAHMVSLRYKVDPMVPKGIPTFEEFRSDTGLTLKIVGESVINDSKFTNFQGFADSAKPIGLSVDRLLDWFTRLRLMYSCSSLTATFIKFIAPELIKNGITKLQSTDGIIIDIDSLIAYTISCEQPDISKKHNFHFINKKNFASSFCPIETNTQKIITHQVLICMKTKAVIDFSLGQFTGNINQSHYYSSVEDMINKNVFPGKVISVDLLPLKNCDQIIDAEIYVFNTMCPNILDKHPLQYSKTIVKNCIKGWNGICRECSGTNSENLFDCSKCKKVSYCGQICQKRHWKREHKYNCKSI